MNSGSQTMTSESQSYELLCKHQKDSALLEGVNALLGWDERTMLPVAGGPYRADQIAFLAGILHQRRTDPQLGEWLDELEQSELVDDPYSSAGATITEVKRSYDKLVKIPQELVEALTRAAVVGQQSWVESRKADDFSMFADQLKEIVRLSKEKADAIGYEDCRYDALLDEYEPQASTAQVADVLKNLGEELGPLVQEIVESGHQAPREILERKYPIEDQKKFSRFAAARIGFDFDSGRIDETHHPFCTTLGPEDCRITTRYQENFFSSAFFGTLHEAGHGIYEQGLRAEWFGLPPGEAASMGIHESQSRMWENMVGRSLPFWEHFFPLATERFDEALEDTTLEEFYWAVNDVRPSLIRVEADEVTYNLHIIIRFELEQELFDDSLQVDDLPAAWSERYQHYLGVAPPSDADGVLQDIHWSAALFGYFPTYSLGNLYAAQLFEKAHSDLDDLNMQFAEGDFGDLFEWLRSNVHHAGRCKPAAKLVEDVCGQPLSSAPLVRYLRHKLDPLYKIG